MVLGKLAIVVGSGIIGTVLTSDVKLPAIGDIFSSALKFMTKHGKQEKDGPSSSNPHTAKLLSQVNHLREELQLLASSRPVTIVTGATRSGPGASTVTAVIVVGAIGYLYIRWKGWKLSDMMIVTKRGLSDACNVVGEQLDHVSESVRAAKKHLSGRIDRVDCSLDECLEITEDTRKEVTVIHGDLSAFQDEMQSVHLVVRNLETKLGRLAYTQDHTTRGIYDLCEFTKRLEQNKRADIRQVSSSSPLPAIESSDRVTRTASLPPPAFESESPAVQSPRTDPSKFVRSPTTVSASGLSMLVESSKPVKREHQGVLSRTCSAKEGSSELSNGSSSSAEPSIRAPTSSSRRFGAPKLPGFGFLRSSAS